LDISIQEEHGYQWQLATLTVTFIHLSSSLEEERVQIIGRKETTRKTKMYVDWIDLAKDRNRWRALVNSVMNLQVP
jgi:hypothetical protein